MTPDKSRAGSGTAAGSPAASARDASRTGARLIKSSQAARLAAVIAPLELKDVQREADAIVESARRRAAETIRQAEETARRTVEDSQRRASAEAEAIRRNAYEEGLAQGRAQGRQEVIDQSLGEAMKQFAAQGAAAVKVLDELARDWHLRRRQLFVDARQDVATLAIAVARRLAPRLGALDGGIAVQTCGEALAMLGQVNEVVIRAHTDDLEAVQRFAEQTYSGLQAGGGIRWVADDSVGRGGVRLESRAGAIDARLPRQVERIADDLLTGWRDRIGIFEAAAASPKDTPQSPREGESRS